MDGTKAIMNNYLALMEKWLQLNQLSLNLNKTVYLTLGGYKDSLPKNEQINK